MTTQRQSALAGIITPQMSQVAKDENLAPEFILEGLAKGAIAIPFNPLHKGGKAVGIGKGLRVKVNANIGTSADFPSIDQEMIKLKTCIDAKSDAVMDLSCGGDLKKIRQAILANCPCPLAPFPSTRWRLRKK